MWLFYTTIKCDDLQFSSNAEILQACQNKLNYIVIFLAIAVFLVRVIFFGYNVYLKNKIGPNPCPRFIVKLIVFSITVVACGFLLLMVLMFKQNIVFKLHNEINYESNLTNLIDNINQPSNQNMYFFNNLTVFFDVNSHNLQSIQYYVNESIDTLSANNLTLFPEQQKLNSNEISRKKFHDLNIVQLNTGKLWIYNNEISIKFFNGNIDEMYFLNLPQFVLSYLNNMLIVKNHES